jgi:hypothetical protein
MHHYQANFYTPNYTRLKVKKLSSRSNPPIHDLCNIFKECVRVPHHQKPKVFRLKHDK